MKLQMEILGITGEETPFFVDPDYEFDAAQFFDFTWPETRSEEEEAEDWFDHAPAYPPSPLAAKTSRDVPISLDNAKKAHDFHRQQGGRPTNGDAAAEDDGPVSRTDPYYNDKDPPPRIGPKVRAQFLASSTSGYMKTTASYLAKHNHSEGLHFHGILRSPAVVRGHKTSSHSSSSNEMRATKRQKLDTGYLQKIKHVMPRSPLQRKAAKMERKTKECILGKPKVTAPREFFLETARRALQHGSKNESQSLGQAMPNSRSSKACSSNNKVPSVPSQKKTTLHSAEEFKIPAAKHPPPVELLKNLSIDSEIRPNSRCQSTSSMSTEMVDAVAQNPLRSHVMQLRCGRDMCITDHRSRASFNR